MTFSEVKGLASRQKSRQSGGPVGSRILRRNVEEFDEVTLVQWPFQEHIRVNQWYLPYII